ncbi:hypothetical protein GO988_04595 [Hymenobacter sp. HMF4947]|uniref:Uncharacterized protein n=1 Tax=Hymenobacter ginkgonis TaxID=2682976 RepID=A0A7K1TB22_9BACT|nr:hypothetical protein [Hymenobacter ginkgonis]MVN75598.1 hypothetical protein [Hymenobacter ginkgonis]
MNPTPTSELLWIAVPGGITGTADLRQAILRVLVVPRLQGSSLAGEGMANWPPPGLATATLAVDFGADADHLLPPVLVAPPHIQAQPGLWEAFFGPATTLRPAEPPTAPVPVTVADTTVRAAAIDATFSAAAATKITPDPASHAELDRVVRKQLNTYWRDDTLPPPPSPIGPTPVAAPVDFHRTLSLLREHPAVLRALGLIIELRLPVAQLPAGLTGVVQVRWPDAPAAPTLPAIVSPFTQYEFEPASQRFLPASTPTISAGMVTLTDDRAAPNGAAKKPRWGVVTVDVDAGAQRLRDAARTLASTDAANAAAAHKAAPNGGPLAGQPSPAQLPALRTAGLLLVRHARQQDFDARQQVARANGQRGAMSTAVLTADDLVLGYRLDINRGGEWRSLHEREATYRVGDLTIATEQPFEEGHLKAQAAVRGSDGALRTDEVVARWSGWSLAVPPPLASSANGGQPMRRLGALPFDFDLTFNVKKGSLPRLQFTQAYQMRARVADIAGGGLGLADPAAARCATASVIYRRYEPVASPELRLPPDVEASSFGPGEALDLLAVRSDPAGNPPTPAGTFLAQNPLYAAYTAARRVLRPPTIALDLAQQHPGALVGAADQTLAALQQAGAPGGSTGSLFAGPLALPDPAAEGIAAFAQPEPGAAVQEPLLHSWAGTWPALDTKQVVLADAPGPAATTAWVAEQLAIALPPAEQLTLELSTFMRGDFLDHFAIKEQLPSESETTVLLGRHPLATPAHIVRLVHAVRRPLQNPAGTLAAVREPGQTFALLSPTPALLTVHAKSTAKLEITAAWTEYSDETTSSVTAAPVQAVVIGPYDKALAEPLRHELGDTRHRMVSYTLTAVSRFRQFFRAEEAPEAFLAPTPLPALNVPSSARPHPPLVLSTRPAFRWEQENATRSDGTSATIRRRHALLRVELQRPWFQSGEGEQLAVIVGPSNQPAAGVQPFLTQVGRDPIWDTPTPEQWPTPPAFAATAGPAAEVLVDSGVATVVAVPYEVWFHDDRWYADIALPGVAAASYCPFVQLAVARYQPSSLPHLELSSIVHTELVQLLPERTLTVNRRGPAAVEILLEGLGPTGPQPNQVDLIVEQCLLPPGVSATTVELTALTPPADTTLAWVAVATATGALGTRLSAQLPASPAGPLRVRVREVERLETGAGAAGAPGTSAELTQRIVFTEVQLIASA